MARRCGALSSMTGPSSRPPRHRIMGGNFSETKATRSPFPTHGFTTNATTRTIGNTGYRSRATIAVDTALSNRCLCQIGQCVKWLPTGWEQAGLMKESGLTPIGHGCMRIGLRSRRACTQARAMTSVFWCQTFCTCPYLHGELAGRTPPMANASPDLQWQGLF